MKTFYYLPLFLLAFSSPMQNKTFASDPETTPYVLVITGNELLRGLYQDGHTQYIATKLGPLGARCVASLCVGDTRNDLLDALEYGVKHAPLVIVTGGLGPTDDDITRETISEFTKIKIAEHPDVLNQMVKRFNTTKEEIRENLRRQTKTPVTGGYLENNNGSAVGLIYDAREHVIVAMPGPPRELQPMVDEELIPYLAERFGTHKIGRSLTMRFVGIGESNIDHTIHQNMKIPNDLMISSLFEHNRVDVTIAVPGDTDDDYQRLKKFEAELLSYISENFYSDDGSTYEMHILSLLKEKNATISIAEIGSGGAIAAALSDAPNSNGVYFGGYVAPDYRGMIKLVHGSNNNDDPDSSEANTIELAKSANQKIGSVWSLAVSSLQTDQNGGTFVWIALGSLDAEFKAHRIGTRGRGESAQKRLVTSVLSLIRQELSVK